MNTVLIVMWFALSQSYMRSDAYYPQIAMQSFATKEACEKAASSIRTMANGKSVQATCVPDA